MEDITERQPPSLAVATAAGKQEDAWVPWHLDRIDQRDLPLDGKFTASSLGSNVNVYIISSVSAGQDWFNCGRQE